MFKTRVSYHILSKAILVALCPVFLVVQLFFSFGISANTGAQNNYSFFRSTAKRHLLKTNTAPSRHHAGFRLNRHFQPESLPSCNTLVIQAPVEYKLSSNQPAYSDHFIPSPFLEAQTLRGPPRSNDFS